MTMTLWWFYHIMTLKGEPLWPWSYGGTLTTIRLWSALPSWLWHYGGPQEKDINGVPFWLWYYVGSLITMKVYCVPSWLWDYGRSITPWVEWGTLLTDIMMKVTSWLTMTLLGTLMTMRLWEIHKTMNLMGYPADCDIIGVPSWLWDYGGTLMTMRLWETIRPWD